MPDFFKRIFNTQTSEVQLTREEQDLESLFTDSEEPRRIFDQLVRAEHLNKHLVVVHGLGGAGKSSLLKMYRLSCRRKRIAVALSAAEDAPSVAALLADWAEDLTADKVQLPGFIATLSKYRNLRGKVEAEARRARVATSQFPRSAVDNPAGGGQTQNFQTYHTVGDIDASDSNVAVGSNNTQSHLSNSNIGTFVAHQVVVGGAFAGGGGSSEAFMDWLRGFLPRNELELYLDPTKQLTADFLHDLGKGAAKQRIVLMTDTYEQMTTFDDWMCDFARQLPENVLLVIAGRAVPDWERDWSGWLGRSEIIELKEMTPDNLRELVHRYYGFIRGGVPDPQQVEAIVQFARGLPMVATTVVQLWVKHGVEDFQSVKSRVVADLVDRLLEGVPPRMRPAFEAAAVLRYFDAEALAAMLHDGDANHLYDELRRWPFIRGRREGLAVHDIMREMINEALKARTPEYFHKLHAQAAAYYEAKMVKANEEERERLGLERLYHLIAADEEAGMKVFQEMAEELARHRMVNRLRVLLKDVNNYSLERESQLLWITYYNGRLAQIEGKTGEAESVYQRIISSRQVESKLLAYSLCELGYILNRPERLHKSGIADTALEILEQSQSLMAESDPKLVQVSAALNGIYRFKGLWDKGIILIERQLQLSQRINDNYGIVQSFQILRDSIGAMGDWRRAADIRTQLSNFFQTMPENSSLKRRFSGYGALHLIWAGNYAEAENVLRNSLSYYEQFGYHLSITTTGKELGLVLGYQGKYAEAIKYLTTSVRGIEELGNDFLGGLGSGNTFWGYVLARQGEHHKAKEKLLHGLLIKKQIQDNEGVPEVTNWLGELQEMIAKFPGGNRSSELETAEIYFRQTLEYEWTARLHFHCGSLTGLVRVKHAQQQYEAICPLYEEAEQLAQKYEYNDHLASLRLTQGHVAWEGGIAEWGEGFEAALNYYKYALIHALRYNRFMLDEVLWGGGISTPLHPIIPTCLARGDEGRRMLTALRDWWLTDTNDIGVPRPDTISPIPEGISLLEGEKLARQREPGDGNPQRNVVAKIDEALSLVPKYQA